ncbi:chemotaxis protein CheA [bacterium]|nr:chemotaxis protein CheA [bacterium]
MQAIMSDPELIKEFLTETNELLENLDNDLVSLETDPQNNELLNRIFRAIHTIKGTSSFLGFDQLVEIGHVSEDVLSMLRDGTRIITQEVMDILLSAVDVVKLLVRQIEDNDFQTIDMTVEIAELTRVKSGELGDPDQSDVPEEEIAVGEPSPEETVPEQEIEPDKPDSTVAPTSATPVSVQEKKPAAAVKAPATIEKGGGTIRVAVERLDDLMNLVGELVLERNRLLQINREIRLQSNASEFIDKIAETAEKVHFVTNELQLSVLKTRMTPIDRLFKKFPRMIRDMGRDMKKDVELIVSGGETELDKTVLDQLGDPLVHLLRNCIDHGLETAQERVAKGKTKAGKVQLSAQQEGNHIIISVKDDGRGLNIEKIKQKALSNELVSSQQMVNMSRQDIFQLIFEPGFSTADKVSNISGRGVGMDVVRTNIRKLNGIIELQSEPDLGTEVVLKLPLTLAIMQSLMVKSQGEIYAVPLASVIETFRIDQSQIKKIDQHDVICHRDSVIPLFYLDRLMDLDIAEKIEDEGAYVVLIGVAEKRYGLVVSKLLGQEEVVIKSLGEFLGNIPGIAGGTITGDGRVRLIIDSGSVAELLS